MNSRTILAATLCLTFASAHATVHTLGIAFNGNLYDIDNQAGTGGPAWKYWAERHELLECPHRSLPVDRR